jgi:hypothetical protein
MFLSEQGIVVSSSRFVVGATTYPLAGITSVSSFVIPAKRMAGILLLVLGLIVLLAGGYVFGAITAAIGILILVVVKPTYVVRMATAGGQVDALVSKDAHYIQRVVGALNQAVIQRG